MTSLSLIFDWILAATLRTSILVLVILIVQRLLRSQLSPKWRYALWLPALAAILIPAQPLLPHWVRLSPEQRRESSTIESSTTAVTVNVAPDDNDLDRHSRSSDSIPSATSSTDRIVENKTNAETGIPIWPETRTSTVSEDIEASEAHAEVEPAWTDVTQPRSWDWRALAVGAWLLGVALLGAIVPISYWLTLRRVRRHVMPVEPSNLAHVELLVRKLGLRRVPRVWLSPVVQTPAVCGLWRPVLLLNANFFQALTHEEADFVLRHELIHIRRGDLLLNTILCILLVLHWFNPLLWYAFFRVRADREAACDDDVLRGEEPARRVAYGTTLLKMETMFRESGLCLGFVGMLQGNNCLRDRIRFISNPTSIGASMKSLLSICMVLAAILGIAKASEPQQNTAKPLPKASKADGLEPWQTDLTEFFDHLQDVARGGKTPDRQYFVDGILRGTDSWAIPTTHTYGKNRELKVFDGFVDLKPKDGTVQWSLNQALKGRSVKWAFEVAKAKVIELDEAAAGDKDVKWILELVPHYDDNGDQFSRKLPVTRLSTIRVAIPNGQSAIPKLTAGDRVRVEGTIGDYAANQGVQLADFTGPIVVYKRKDEDASLQTTVSIGLRKAKVTTTQAASSFKIRKLSSVPTINKYDKHTRVAVSIDQKSVLARVPDGERSGRAGILFKQRYGVYLSSLDAKDPKRTRLGDPYFGFVPKSNLAYLVSWGDGVQFWDTRTHTRSGDYIPHELREDTTIGPALSPSGKVMVTRSQLNHLQFWNIETRKPITKEIKQAGTVYGMEFSSDGKWFFSKTNKRWRSGSQKPERWSLGH